MMVLDEKVICLAAPPRKQQAKSAKMDAALAESLRTLGSGERES